MRICVLLFLFSLSNLSLAQNIGINTDDPDPSAALHVKSTNTGMLIPRMTSGQRAGIADPAKGLLVYDLETKSFWYFSGSNWQDLSAPGNLIEDTDKDTYVDVESTSDVDEIHLGIKGTDRVNIDSAHIGMLFPDSSTIIGFEAGKFNAVLTDVSSDDQGKFNKFLGMFSGRFNNPDPNICGGYEFFEIYEGGCGSHNTFMGNKSGFSNSLGRNNTFVGSRAGYANIGTGIDFNVGFGGAGAENTYMGFLSGQMNQNGFWNTFMGAYSGEHNGKGVTGAWSSQGSKNTYLGATAGRFIEKGFANTYVGTEAGGEFDNITGTHNTYLGHRAGYRVGGIENVYVGSRAGEFYAPGELASSRNVYMGMSSGLVFNGSGNVAIGTRAGEFAKGSNNVLIGHIAGQYSGGSAGENNVIIGFEAGSTRHGTGNVLLGSGAGKLNTADQMLIIDNGMGDNENPFLSGSFAEETLLLNGKFHIKNNDDVSLINDGALYLGDENNKNVALDRDEIQARNNGFASSLYFQNSGGQVVLGNSSDVTNDKLFIESGSNTAPLRVRQAGQTKLRVHTNGGTSIGINATPPSNGLLVDGHVAFNNNTVVTANSGLTFKVGSTTVEIASNGDVVITANANITFNANQNINLNAGGVIRLNAALLRLNAPSGGVPTARVGSIVSGNQVVTGSNSVLIGN